MQQRKGDWFITASGKQVWPCDVRPEDLDIEDIAHALSMQCRFAGHTRIFYSVAEHSVLVSKHLPPELALVGLLHDAAESLVQDIIRPIKIQPSMQGYRDIEQLAEHAVCVAFDLPYPFPPEIKDADLRALATERRDLIKPVGPVWFNANYKPFEEPIVGLMPDAAKRLFLDRYHDLIAARVSRKRGQ